MRRSLALAALALFSCAPPLEPQGAQWPLPSRTGPLVRGVADLPDLVVEKVKPVRVVEASHEVVIRVRNKGSADAPPFAMMAFRRSPKAPVMLTACALTEAERAAGGSAQCGALWSTNPLPPDASVEWTGYVTFPIGGGAGLPANRIGPPPKKPAKETVDIMADGCVHASVCKVEEIDEVNNFADAVVVIP